MNILKEINTEVKDAFEKAGYDSSLGFVTLSNRPDLCDFQCNGGLVGGKKYKKNPLSIAEDVVKHLDMKKYKKIEIVNPGFINITVSNNYLEDKINIHNSFRDIVEKNNSKTIIIDYGGPNIAKPLHVGHVRSANIGESIKRISRYLGHNVIGDIHFGDWGLQMGLVITEIQDRHPDIPYFKNDYTPSKHDTSPVTINELNEIYPFASKKSETDEEYLKRAYIITKSLQEKEVGYYDLWKKIVEVSVNDMKKSYNILNVDFDLWNGESDADEYVNELLDILEEKNLMYESEGAIIVNVTNEDDKKEVPPIIIVKSDGSQLYSTTDLATILQREKDYSPDEYLYVVDNRQSLHFTQVFRCARLSDIVQENTNLEFVGFGTMNGKDGKPYKTRDGGVMKLNDLINIMISKSLERIENNIDKNIQIDEEEKNNIAEKVGVSALKFGDLYNHRSRDYVFDIDRFISFEGKTGPYLLYNVARINSILEKVTKVEKINLSSISFSDINIYSNTEKELLLKILMSENVILKSFEEKAPNYICEHVYNITTSFSKFYDESKIIGEDDKEKQKSWIGMILLVKDVVTSLLDLLAIETVDRM